MTANIAETYLDADLPAEQPLARRMTKRPSMMHYNRLIVLVTAVNLVILFYGLNYWQWWAAGGIDLSALSNLVIGNLALAILIRQQYVINFLF